MTSVPTKMPARPTTTVYTPGMANDTRPGAAPIKARVELAPEEGPELEESETVVGALGPELVSELEFAYAVPVGGAAWQKHRYGQRTSLW